MSPERLGLNQKGRLIDQWPLQLKLSSSFSFLRDRVGCVWQTVRDHLYHLCVQAQDFCFLVDRAVVGLLRLAIRLLRREEISGQVNRVYLGGQKSMQGTKVTVSVVDMT